MRIRNIFKVFVVVVAVLLPAFAQANQITDAIQKRYDSLSSFQADFQQELTNAASGSVEKRSGKIWFKKSLVRWETLKPEKELLIVGQQHVWDYFEVDHIAMKYRTNQAFGSSKTMIRFLSGKANLKEDFKIEEQGTENGLVKLRLIPKEPEPTMVLAYIWVDTKTNILARVLTVDFYGNGNQVSLNNLALDNRVDSRLFDFTPPAGVQVKDNSKQK